MYYVISCAQADGTAHSDVGESSAAMTESEGHVRTKISAYHGVALLQRCCISTVVPAYPGYLITIFRSLFCFVSFCLFVFHVEYPLETPENSFPCVLTMSIAQDLHGGPDITAIRQARGRGPRATHDDIVHTCAIMMANPSSEGIQTEGNFASLSLCVNGCTID